MDKTTIIDKLVINHTAKCRNANGQSTNVHFNVDYAGCSINDLAIWATSNRTISGQRAWEKYSSDEIMELVNGKTFHARTIGQRIKSASEIENDLDTYINSLDADARKAYIDKLVTNASK